MTKFKALLKLHFKAALTGVGFAGTNKKKKLSSFAVMALLGGLMLYIGGTYGVMLFSILPKMQSSYSLAFCIMSVLALLMSFMLSVFSAQGVVFGNKDLDILLSLPITQFPILLSKLLAVYLEAAFIFVCTTLPTIVLYQVNAGFSVVSLLLQILAILVLPFISTLLSLVVSFALAFLNAKIRGAKIINMVITFGAFLLLMGGIFYMQTAMFSVLQDPTVALASIYKYALPLRLMGQGIFDGNILSFLLFVATSIVPFLVVSWFFSLKYQYIVTSTLVKRTTKKKLDMSKTKATSSFAALVKKEFNKYFGIQILVFNTGFGVIMIAVATIAAFVFKNDIVATASQIATQLGINLTPIIPFIIAIAIGMMASTCYFTAVATSLESKQMWLIKSLPISTQRIFASQIAVNACLTAIPLVLSSIALNILFGSNILVALFGCIFGVAMLLPGWIGGAIINMLLPKMDALSDTAIVKQSASSILGMFFNWGIIIAAGIAFVSFMSIFSPVLIMLALTVILLIISFLLWKFLTTKGANLFYNL